MATIGAINVAVIVFLMGRTITDWNDYFGQDQTRPFPLTIFLTLLGLSGTALIQIQSLLWLLGSARTGAAATATAYGLLLAALYAVAILLPLLVVNPLVQGLFGIKQRQPLGMTDDLSWYIPPLLIYATIVSMVLVYPTWAAERVCSLNFRTGLLLVVSMIGFTLLLRIILNFGSRALERRAPRVVQRFQVVIRLMRTRLARGDSGTLGERADGSSS